MFVICEDGFDFGDFDGDDLRDCVDGGMASHDEVPEHQASRQGTVTIKQAISTLECYFVMIYSNSCQLFLLLCD